MNSLSHHSSTKLKIVVAMTCHNRKDMSIRAVTQLRGQSSDAVEIDFVAVDDGSEDGTADALKALGVRVLPGNGKLYWAGGMRLAHSAAMLGQPDLILWINDDLDIEPTAIQVLLTAYFATQGRKILAGPVASSSTGNISYGGRLQNKRNPLSFELAGTDYFGRSIDTFNGNFVGIPRAAYEAVPFPDGYIHAYADLAFGIAAIRRGFPSYLLPSVIGVNDRNPQTGKMFRHDIGLWARVRFACSPFGLPPRQHWRFARLVAGLPAPFWFARSYLRVLVPTKKLARDRE